MSAYCPAEFLGIRGGFLIVRPFAYLYQRFIEKKNHLSKPIYAIPQVDRPAESMGIQYRGLDREALRDWEGSDNLAEVQMGEFNRDRKCGDGIIPDRGDLDTVLDLLENRENYEILWTRIAGSDLTPPPDFVSIGFEATYFYGDHFSASCDCMMIPRWHGTDTEGVLFGEHFRKLNEFGLFPSADDATNFLEYYLSFDWTERGDPDYKIAEIFISQAV